MLKALSDVTTIEDWCLFDGEGKQAWGHYKKFGKIKMGALHPIIDQISFFSFDLDLSFSSHF